MSNRFNVVLSMVIAVSGLAGLVGCAGKSSSGVHDFAIIDTHIHLYDTSRPGGVPWPPVTDKVLYRPVLPDGFDPICKKNGVTGVVVVEASNLLDDNDWVLRVTNNNDLYIGLVAFLDIQAIDFPHHLERLCKNPRFVGIRLRQGKVLEKVLTDTALSNLKLLAQEGKTLDILVSNITLEQAHGIAVAVPDLDILINHVGGLIVDGKPLADDFKNDMRKLGACSNVHCKVSGIFQRTGKRPSPKDAAFYKFIFDEVWGAFGEDRLIYGSNWPVTDRGGKYGEQLAIIVDYFKQKGNRALGKVMSENAAKFYGVGIKK